MNKLPPARIEAGPDDPGRMREERDHYRDLYHVTLAKADDLSRAYSWSQNELVRLCTGLLETFELDSLDADGDEVPPAHVVDTVFGYFDELLRARRELSRLRELLKEMPRCNWCDAKATHYRPISAKDAEAYFCDAHRVEEAEECDWAEAIRALLRATESG